MGFSPRGGFGPGPGRLSPEQPCVWAASPCGAGTGGWAGAGAHGGVAGTGTWKVALLLRGRSPVGGGRTCCLSEPHDRDFRGRFQPLLFGNSR